MVHFSESFQFCVDPLSLAIMIADVTEYSGDIFKCDERFTLPTTSTHSYDCGLLAKKFLFYHVINSIKYCFEKNKTNILRTDEIL